MTRSSPLLVFEGIKACYGKIVALKGVDLHVNKGEIVTLIGANGAGKSTLMMSLFASPAPSEGRIIFDGQDLSWLPPHEIARLGIAQAPEGRRIFARMTVYENLQMGCYVNKMAHFKEDLERVLTLFPRLKERLHQQGSTLSGGEQQMLAIGRALTSRPKLLLLDEPSLGLAPLVSKKIFTTIREINKEGVTIFFVEQNAYQALLLADRAYVMVNGAITREGVAKDLLADPQIREMYLGGKTQNEKTQGGKNKK